jgi:hypothetical protein
MQISDPSGYFLRIAKCDTPVSRTDSGKRSDQDRVNVKWRSVREYRNRVSGSAVERDRSAPLAILLDGCQTVNEKQLVK